MNIYNMLNGEISFNDLLNYYNANITYVNLSQGINGFVFQYKDVYNIFINNKLSYKKIKKTILHELAHIELNQLNRIDKDLFAFQIQKYEDEADTYLKLLFKLLNDN